MKLYIVATVLTVYGIETSQEIKLFKTGFIRLQQYLPFTVLKPSELLPIATELSLQQYLPFTVLKLY